MDPFYILAIVVMTLLFIGIPITLIFLFHRFLMVVTSKKISLVITIFLSLLLSYFLYLDFYPTNNFYLKDYEKNTAMELPNSAKLIEKKGNNSIYSIGDYNISYTVELTPNNFDRIQSELQERGFEKSEMYLQTLENGFLLSRIKDSRIKTILVKEEGFKNYEVLFLDDKKTIICNSNKW